MTMSARRERAKGSANEARRYRRRAPHTLALQHSLCTSSPRRFQSPFCSSLRLASGAAVSGGRQGGSAWDPRLTTTIHLSGGTNPDIAEGHATLPNLHRPAAFICGEPGGDGLVVGDTASEWCAYDFEHTDVPVFLAQITGASHISAPGMTTGACAAWLRWHLMGDATMRQQFAGDDCVLCKRPNWVTKSKDL